MFSKVMVKGEIEIVTGIHIGTGGEFSAIGTADSPVVRDSLTGKPVIPGSSLKGKLRSVLARKYSPDANGAEGDCEELKNLFGSTSRPSRLVFSDMIISNEDELEKNYNIYTPTEVKFENTINRLSGVANPRQIERVIRGCKFDMEIIYNLSDLREGEGDLKLLAEGLKLLSFDYLGGHGSRGYGKIKFNNLGVEVIVGDDVDDFIENINAIFKEVN